jgi:hypothetical protein
MEQHSKLKSEKPTLLRTRSELRCSWRVSSSCLFFLFFSLFFYIFFLHCDSWSSKTNCSKFSAWDSCYILKDAIKWNENNWIIKTKSFCILFLNCQINIHTVKLFPFFFLNSLSNPANLSNGNLTRVYVCNS